MTCYLAVWKINVIHNMLHMIQIGPPPPPPPMRVRADLQQIESKGVYLLLRPGQASQHPLSVLLVSGSTLLWFFLVVSAIACSPKTKNLGERYMQKQ